MRTLRWLSEETTLSGLTRRLVCWAEYVRIDFVGLTIVLRRLVSENYRYPFRCIKWSMSLSLIGDCNGIYTSIFGVEWWHALQLIVSLKYLGEFL